MTTSLGCLSWYRVDSPFQLVVSGSAQQGAIATRPWLLGRLRRARSERVEEAFRRLAERVLRRSTCDEANLGRLRRETSCWTRDQWQTNPSGSQRSCQAWSCFHKKTWPLMRRLFLSVPAMASISSGLRGSDNTEARLDSYSLRLIEKWNRCLAPLDSPLDADHGRMDPVILGDSGNHRIFNVDGVIGAPGRARGA